MNRSGLTPILYLTLILIVFFFGGSLANGAAFSNLKGKIIFHGIGKFGIGNSAGMTLYDLGDGTFNSMTATTGTVEKFNLPKTGYYHTTPFLYIANTGKVLAVLRTSIRLGGPPQKQLILFKPQGNIFNPQKYSYETLLDLTDRRILAHAISPDESLLFLNVINLKEENTYKRGESPNYRGRYNFNKSELFIINLKEGKLAKRRSIPYMSYNMSISPDKQWIAYDYIQFVVEGEKTYDEVAKSGTYILSTHDLDNPDRGRFREGITFYKWSPDGQMESYIEGNYLIIRKIEDQSIIRKVKFPGVIEECAWSPDSKYMVYQYLSGFFGILSKTRILELESGKKKTLLNFMHFITSRRTKSLLQWIK